MATPLESAHDLMRRLSPQNVEQNLLKLLDLAPELTEDLLSSIDTPLKVQKCAATGKDYLLCDYNRDGDSYRFACHGFRDFVSVKNLLGPTSMTLLSRMAQSLLINFVN